VRQLYDIEGWWPERSISDIERILEAGPALGAWNGAQLVGFVRAVADGVARAYVEDMIVDADRRGEGIGSRLITGLHERLVDIPIVSLFCGAELVPFYESVGYRFTSQSVGHRAAVTGRGTRQR
jgi:GNAT superfamily N-acetyltransferase